MANVIYDWSEQSLIRERERMREKALHDEASAMKKARAEARAKGAADKEAEIIANMKALGMSNEQISRIISGTNQ